MSIKPFSNPHRSAKNSTVSNDAQEIVRSGQIALGKVKQVLSQTGEIRVWLEGSTSSEFDDQFWIKVRYASPFMGFTKGDPLRNENKIDYTKQAYGFSMILPDVDNFVLCAFPETGTKSEGYWFATVSMNFNNHSLPAHGSVARSRIDDASIPPEIAKFLRPSGIYPVGEPNERLVETVPSILTLINDVKKPINPELTVQYITQGLDMDIHRGTIKSSSQRLDDDAPRVFGISTPGRNKPGQNRRLAGHSFIMDDGDILGGNKLTRWRTAAGHQILMNDNIGTIYVSNASGLSWIELTAQGDVLVYGARDFAVRTQGNIELHSDKSVRIDATDINMFAKNSMKFESEVEMTQYSGKILSQHSGESFSINTVNNLNINSGGVAYLKSAGEIDIKGSRVTLNTGGGKAASIVPTQIERERYPDTIFDASSGWAVQNDLLFSICNRVPAHEPYLRGSFEGTAEALKSFVASQEYDKKKDASKIQSKDSVIQKTTDSSAFEDSTANEALAGIQEGMSATGAISNLTSGSPALASTLANKPPNIAPESSFKNQPVPAGAVANLEPQETQALFAQIGHTESSGKYDAVNQFGYAGKYQMGAAALQDAGLLKPGTKQSVEAMQNPDNWIGGPGKPKSLDEFLANEELQEKTMVDYTNRNYQTLKRIGAIDDNSSKEDISGALAASHLVGPGGAAKLIKTGVDPQDANGTKASQYFANGSKAITKATTIAQAEQSKRQLGA